MTRRNKFGEDSLSETTTTTIQNPRHIDAPTHPKPGFLTGTTGDDIRESKPTEDLTAQDFGLKPGGPQLPDTQRQRDDEAREQYERVRLQAQRPEETEVEALRRRVAELEAEKVPAKS